jgi:hypothetical protein
VSEEEEKKEEKVKKQAQQQRKKMICGEITTVALRHNQPTNQEVFSFFAVRAVGRPQETNWF